MTEAIELSHDPRFWARRYVDAGFELIPLATAVDGKCSCFRGGDCAKPGKHPLVEWTKGGSSKDKGVVDGWFERWPSFNLALRMGNGIVAIDLDKEEGKANFARLVEDHGGLEAFPVTKIQATGGGGLHVLLRLPPGVDITDDTNGKKLGKKIDVKYHGYVVAAPSMHKSGARYEWADWEAPIADCPAWLLALLVDDGPQFLFDFGDWISAELKGGRVAKAGEGGDNRTWLVCCRAAQSGIRQDEEFLRAIAKWNANCQPPWREDDLLRKFHDAVEKVVEDGKILVPLDRKGRPIYSLPVLQRVLSEDQRYRYALKYNSFLNASTYEGKQVDDYTWSELRTDLCSRYGWLSVPKKDVEEAAEVECRRHPFNPLTDRLNRLRWDGVARLDRVAEEVLRAKSPLGAVYFRKWAIGAVKRAYEPGCKLDVALILTGRQGAGKSQFFKRLATWGKESYFSDTNIDLANKDAYMQIAGAWVYEWPELETAFRARASETVKAFLSSAVDKYRVPYGKTVMEYPRTCVVVGTTNQTEIVHDSTGSRRFWILEVGEEVVLARVDAWRDQLWAEAVVRYRQGEACWLSKEEELLREGVAEEFEHTSPLFERAIEWLAKILEPGGLYEKQGYLRLADVCKNMFREDYQLTMQESKELGKALRRSGFSKQAGIVAGKHAKVWICRRPQPHVDP